ncbi:hypothetical protein CWI42_012140 [Ordospora colligata]|uniref:Uncharacterized protein n=1 Tax=Ordospora colligata OC4 TaxID=1354746 RepID=A0A0B2UMF7_9MICR|nr:uncharacterized protein M896_012140 [Ordospora colligata OC4]KHN70558.1 hypothetical protein M896_012140 [Ordospora colligata OC4]TBU17308.1 hypothetical protein CWI41_012140 [Ordospora colligata]TBU17558.1 hypothetical protein CWI40_012140 [Ordospora colligata]TBU19738.1 hypothetical protein CWI42_012140 [Ordospora colligata]
MDSFEIRRVEEKMEKLYDSMVVQMPLEGIKKHPFDWFRQDIDRVVTVIEEVISDFECRRRRAEEEIRMSVDLLNKECVLMECVEPQMPNLCNLELMKAYVENEIGRVAIVRRGVNEKMERVMDEIKEILDEVPDIEFQAIVCMNGEGEYFGKMERKDEEYVGEVSLQRLRELEANRDMLKSEKERREKKRNRLYGELCVFLSRLSVTDLEVRIDQKIFVLEELHKKYNKEVEMRISKVVMLEEQIRRKEVRLDVDCKEVAMNLSEENITRLEEYNEYLGEEQRRRLDEIYEKKKDVLKSLFEMFGMNIIDYERTEEGVEEMTKIIGELESKKELFVLIKSLIDKRSELVDRMNEFEKEASDPRRLFRSSFQLINEEKFRNSAYPNLIKIEEMILKSIDEYEEQFGEFICGGVGYKECLKHEIDNRIVNKTVFINRFDSPSKRRK